MPIFFISIILSRNIGRTAAGEENSPIEAQEHYRGPRPASPQHGKTARFTRRFVRQIGAAWSSGHANITVEVGK